MTGPSPYDPCVSQPIGDRKRTVEEALAQGVAGWSRAGSVLVRPLEELGTRGAVELGLVLGSYALLALMVNSFDVDLPPDRKESVMPV